jgi:DNA-binding beta-propeller fold protein YncE
VLLPARLFLVAVVAAASLGASPAGKSSLVLDDGAEEPFGVAFPATGEQVYVVEYAGRVVVVEPSGARRVLADGLNGPHQIAMGSDGLLYVTDTWNNRVRRIDPATGAMTLVAGTGEKGFSGDGGPALAARFGGIYSIAFHGGSLYLCDLDNRRIRAMDLASGLVRTVAGNGEKGVPRDGGDALAEPLVDPRAIAFDSKGRLYICERGGHAVRVVDMAGKIRTVVGTGEKGFSGDGGPAILARLDGPKHLEVDAQDRLLVTDTENHVIRRYSPADGRIERLVGTGTKGAGGVGGPPALLELNRPHGAAVHPRTGALYVSDSENHRVLRIDELRGD